ncbi:MAG TPA: amino acid adenylation domain-containing protein, partial [Thermoanaerobaculia bacterium]|nr:amino acid adenylation domain-containing protein [Thermoanaerobaculia bacterium]
TFCVFLRRHTGGDDVALGTPVANRGRPELEPLIGLFANTLVLRAELAGDPGFLEALERLRLASLDAIAHQELPFERLVEELQPDRDLSRNPLFDVLFSYREGEIESLRLPGLQVEPMDSGTGTAKFDLSLSVSRSEDRLRRLRLRLEYATDLFEPATAQRLAERLQVLLADVSENPSRRISELALLSEAEHRQLLVDWNQTGAEVPEAGIHELIERQAKRTPQAVALAAGAGITWSYAELEAGANRLARHLQRLGVGPEVPVGIHLERSPAMVAAVLAVLKAGAAYLPLDPAYPADRLAFMLADSAAPVVITSRDLPGLPAGPRAIFLDDLDWAEGDGGRRLPRADASLAYVLYTSGSTGKPKGVQVTHRNVVNFFAAMDAVLGTEPGTWFAVTSLSFDISVLELLWTLARGFRVVIPDEERRFSEQIVEHGATHLQCTPSLAQALAAEPEAREALRPLRKLLLGGEALPAALAEDLAGLLEGELLNMYGPTETTVWSATHRVEAGRGAVPIGRPVANTTVYLLDPAGKPAPLGIPAELAIGGLGVTRGYLKRPDLTAERFVPDPFSSRPGERLYRTGDLARWRSCGELEFLGRLDHQVKVRGHRIELGEVETALERHPGVARAVVMAHDERLVAYVVGRQTPAPAAAELRDWVRRELPEAMVPSLVVELEALPLTPNGKIDRKALPAPEAARSGEAAAAPQGPLEELLASVWREMLGVESVGREESFFELGGHSLLVMRIVARLRDVLGVEVSPRSFFEAPTIAGLGHSIERARREGRAPLFPPILPVRPELREAGIPLSFGQQRLWFLDRLEPGRAAYQLGGGFRFLGPLDAGALARALAEIVRRHESLRTRIAEVDGMAMQVVSPAAALPLPLIDLSALPEAGRTAAGLAGEVARLPFDLDSGPLLRSVLVRLAAQEHVLVLAVHHVVFDGGSLGVLAHELGRLYGAFDSGRPSPLPELPVQYSDFAAWQRTWLQGEVLAEQVTWWKEHLAGAPVALDLPADRPRPAMPSRRGGMTSAFLGLESWKRLQDAGRSCGLTPFMTLFAVFSVLLSRYGGQQDLVVGTPISGRRLSEIEGLIGLFANTLALRTRLDGDLSFTGLAKQVRSAALGAFVHQDLPFEKLVDELQVERDLSRSPLFQTLFLLQNPSYPYWDLSVPAVSPWPVDTGRVQFDLVLAAVPQAKGLEVRLHFDRDLFDGATATRMAAHYANLLEAVGTPGTPGMV